MVILLILFTGNTKKQVRSKKCEVGKEEVRSVKWEINMNYEF